LKPPDYVGRTLVQNNLVFNNGGSGIHSVTTDHVDIQYNTAYMNSASPHLQYSQIYTYESDDVNIRNNILVAPTANIAAGEKPEPVNQLKGKNGKVVFSNNLYFGGNIAPTLGEGDRIGDPKFVKATLEAATADFRLSKDSPARAAAAGASPLIDRTGNLRTTTGAGDLGALEAVK
jgi:Right handed beta helix region